MNHTPTTLTPQFTQGLVSALRAAADATNALYSHLAPYYYSTSEEQRQHALAVGALASALYPLARAIEMHPPHSHPPIVSTIDFSPRKDSPRNL